MIAIGVAVVIIIGIIAAFTYGRHAPSQKSTPNQISLTDHTTDGSEVRLTIQGPVNANELHRSSSVSVSRDSRAVEFDKTYDDIPITSATYINNQDAFDDFMTALQNAGFTKQKSNTQADDTGQCPQGQRYEYALIINDTVALHTWSSSCQGKNEPFGGKAALVQALFRAQIPDYAKLQNASVK